MEQQRSVIRRCPRVRESATQSRGSCGRTSTDRAHLHRWPPIRAASPPCASPVRGWCRAGPAPAAHRHAQLWLSSRTRQEKVMMALRRVVGSARVVNEDQRLGGVVRSLKATAPVEGELAFRCLVKHGAAAGQLGGSVRPFPIVGRGLDDEKSPSIVDSQSRLRKGIPQRNPAAAR